MEFFDILNDLLEADSPGLIWVDRISPQELHELEFNLFNKEERMLLNDALHRFELGIAKESNYQAINDLTGLVPFSLGWFTWFRGLERAKTFTITRDNWVDTFFEISMLFDDSDEIRKDIEDQALKTQIRNCYVKIICSIFKARLAVFGIDANMQYVLLGDKRVRAWFIPYLLEINSN